MEQEKLWEEFAALPPEAQRQVIDFIAFMRLRYEQVRPGKKPRRIDLADEPFIGMWRGREDMEESSVWVRSVRKREWAKDS